MPSAKRLKLKALTLVGFMISPRFFLLYLSAGAVYFLILLIAQSLTIRESFFLALGLLTGSDPYGVRNSIESCWVTWWAGWTIHVFSWLFVPALAGFIFNQIVNDFPDEHLEVTLEVIAEDLKRKTPEQREEFKREWDAIFEEAGE